MTMRRRIALAAGCALAALLAACSTPATRVVLLPQADGRPSAVVVRAKGGEQTLDKPFQRATAPVGAAGAPAVDAADPAQVRKDNATLFDLMPPGPQRYTVYFDAGGTVLTEASQQTVQDMLAAAAARPGADIVVTGHTDTVGTGPQNDQLSRRRAEELRQLLIQRGFPGQRIEAAGRGERDLAVPTADEVDEPRNRRVTIEVR
ncbi:MAG: OmpA family protein [Pseudomonadota bacterium]|nr:OmpA family protein [Pseudomonadota bacterium]MDQ8002723.1 OmpA family protein [Pseudomonadota bacterium]